MWDSLYENIFGGAHNKIIPQCFSTEHGTLHLVVIVVRLFQMDCFNFLKKSDNL